MARRRFRSGRFAISVPESERDWVGPDLSRVQSGTRYRIVYSNPEQGYASVVGGLELRAVLFLWGQALAETGASITAGDVAEREGAGRCDQQAWILVVVAGGGFNRARCFLLRYRVLVGLVLSSPAGSAAPPLHPRAIAPSELNCRIP